MKHVALQLIAVIGLSCLLAGCGGSVKHAGPTSFDQPSIVVSRPASMVGGLESVWQVSIDGGTPPFQVTWDLGAGALEAVGEETITGNQLEIAAIMLNPTDGPVNYIFTLTMTDSLGIVATLSGNYTVALGAIPTRPVIESADYRVDMRELGISVSHWNAPAELSVDLTLPAGMNAPFTSESRIAIGQAEFYFKLWPNDIMDGNTGTVVIEATDSLGFSDQLAAEITVPGYELAPDTLYAIPLQTHVRVGEPVTIVIATGPIAEDKPFQYLNGVRIIPNDGNYEPGGYLIGGNSYVTGSFNAGAPGGGAGDVDGFWEQMWPEGGFLLGDPGPFLLPPDSLIGFPRWELDFNLTPIGGRDVTGAAGALINIQVAFYEPGEIKLEFQEVSGVERTYYTDGETNIYFWEDISNDHPGIPNTITVIE